MNIKTIILFVFVFSIGLSTKAQEVGIGEWRDHLPYSTAVSLAVGDNKIYCAAEQSLFYYLPEDNSVNKLSRVQGLSDIGIAKIGFNNAYKTLVIAYSNTNIDLIKGNTIINKSDILNSSAITPEESVINNLMFIDQYVYLSCGFGIVVLDVDKEEITDTYFIGPNGSHLQVYDLTVNDTSFFAATEEGIYHARIDDPELAFGAWSKDETLPYPDGIYNHIAINDGVIYANKYFPEWAGDTIIYYQDKQWKYNNDVFPGSDVYSLDVINDKLYISYSSQITILNSDITESGTIWSYYGSSPRSREVIVHNNDLWIADNRNGLVRQNADYTYTFIYPNGPYSADAYAMSSQGSEVWVAPGGKDLSWQNIWKSAKLFVMEDGMWTTIDNSDETNPALDTIYDIITVEVNPFNNKQVYAGTWHRGLIEITDGLVTNVYSENNSSLQNISGAQCRTGGLKFDKNGNLWVTNAGVNNILSVRMNDGSDLGKWRSFYLGTASANSEIGELIIDQSDQKWIIMRPTKMITVFNDNGTPDDPSDDLPAKQLSTSVNNGNLPGSGVFSLALDQDGEIWVGTDEGLAVFYSPENVFSNYNYDAQRILIPRNDGTGLADILLEFEVITAIAVDGANNKWVGTENSGVYMFTPDGLSEIHHFTMDNSPLLSNSITSISINNVNGEVFFGTANGIISYKSTATEGGSTNEDVYAYPNPVRPGYSGPIAIKGLVTDASFKITDINGALVYTGTAEGGQAVWDGKSQSGRVVQSGVYLVFVTDNTGDQTLVTKILFMN